MQKTTLIFAFSVLFVIIWLGGIITNYWYDSPIIKYGGWLLFIFTCVFRLYLYIQDMNAETNKTINE